MPAGKWTHTPSVQRWEGSACWRCKGHGPVKCPSDRAAPLFRRGSAVKLPMSDNVVLTNTLGTPTVTSLSGSTWPEDVTVLLPHAASPSASCWILPAPRRIASLLAPAWLMSSLAGVSWKWVSRACSSSTDFRDRRPETREARFSGPSSHRGRGGFGGCASVKCLFCPCTISPSFANSFSF